jgi:hypothetical protein
VPNISQLNSPLSPFSFIPHFPIPGIVSTDIIFSLTYMCAQYLYHIHPSSYFPHFFPLPTVTTLLPEGPDLLSCSQILYKKKKEKKLNFS